MARTLTDAAALSGDAQFMARLNLAVYQYALKVGEQYPDTWNAPDQGLVQAAFQIRNAPGSYTPAVVNRVLLRSAISADATDDELTAEVETFFYNTFSDHKQ